MRIEELGALVTRNAERRIRLVLPGRVPEQDADDKSQRRDFLNKKAAKTGWVRWEKFLSLLTSFPSVQTILIHFYFKRTRKPDRSGLPLTRVDWNR